MPPKARRAIRNWSSGKDQRGIFFARAVLRLRSRGSSLRAATRKSAAVIHPENTRFEALAHPRLALLGNPSDAYFGRVLAMAFSDFAARAVVELGGRSKSDGGQIVIGGCSFGDPRDLRSLLPGEGIEGGARLQLAALHQFQLHAPDAVVALIDRGARLSFESDIPRQAGLAGSSAIVIATLRALCVATDRELSAFELAEAALRAETEDLGIAAGPQDRVIQSYQGLLFMDFAPPRDPARYQEIDSGLLPPLFVVFGSLPGQDSGRVHVDVRGRFLRGDEDVVAAMDVFAETADAGLAALRSGDAAGFRTAVDRNFDLRADLFRLGPSDRILIDLGRAHGAAMKFPGSGGAALGVARDVAHRQVLIDVFRARGFGALAPQLAPRLAPPGPRLRSDGSDATRTGGLR